MHHIRLATLVVAASFLSACADDVATAPDTTEMEAPMLSVAAAESHAIPGMAAEGDIEAFYLAEMAEMNAQLEAEGSNMRVDKVELLLDGQGPVDVGTTIYANNRTLQLGYVWVQGDARRDGRDHLTYLVDESHAYAYNRTVALPGTVYMGGHFDASFAPWTTLSCGNMSLVRVADNGTDPSFYDYAGLNDGAYVTGQADIVEAGWRPLPTNVLGTTYTWVFVDDEGNPTDINGDGRRDTARTEIWYALGYYWTTTTDVSGIDFLSVAIHENGHSIGLGHFGQIFRSEANGKLHFSPRAIMNAAYVSRMQDLQGSDEASFCGNYAAW